MVYTRSARPEGSTAADGDRAGASGLWEALDVCHAAFVRGLTPHLAAYELTRPQFDVLDLLDGMGKLPLGEIGRHLQVTAGNVTCVVANLERRGLVLRERSATDKRVVGASLTDAGRERLARLAPGRIEAVAHLSGALTIDEQAILFRLLRKWASSMAPATGLSAPRAWDL